MKTIGCIALLGTLLLGAALNGPAQADVVADSACPQYAVDNAAFASCDGAHVARADGIEFLPPPLVAHMKQVHEADLLLIDVRSGADPSTGGIATQVDARVPYQALAQPLHRDAGSRDAAATRNAGFVAVVQAAVLARGGGREMPLLLLCRDGTVSLRAAEDLRAAGFTHVYVVDGGYEGWLVHEQRRRGS